MSRSRRGWCRGAGGVVSRSRRGGVKGGTSFLSVARRRMPSVRKPLFDMRHSWGGENVSWHRSCAHVQGSNGDVSPRGRSGSWELSLRPTSMGSQACSENVRRLRSSTRALSQHDQLPPGSRGSHCHASSLCCRLSRSNFKKSSANSANKIKS